MKKSKAHNKTQKEKIKSLLKTYTQRRKIKFSGKTYIVYSRVNKELSKYDNIVLFPEKVEQANKILEKVKLPV